MHSHSRQLFVGAAVAIFLTLAFSAIAQDQKAAADTPTQPAADAGTPATGTPPAADPAADTKDDTSLRRIDEPTDARDKQARKRGSGARNKIEGVRITRGRNSNDRVAFGSNAFLGKDDEADSVVAIFGSANSEGRVHDSVVAILGNARVTGETGDSVVAVMGNAYVNSKVGEVVAALGNVELGPLAEVQGDVVSAGGEVTRDPAAIVHGAVQSVALGGIKFGGFDGLRAWFTHAVMLGRPLAIGPNLGWVWAVALSFLALYVIVAFLFAPAVQQCTVTLETRPGYSLLSTILTVLLIPVAIVVLCISVVGVALVPLLLVGLFVAAVFGKVVMLGWVGTRFTRLFGHPLMGHAAVAVLIGGILVLGLYLVPILGFIVFKLLAWLGVGVVVYTLILRMKQESKPAVAMAAPAPAGGFASTGTFAGDPTMTPPPLMGVPVLSAATLPRAGFWIRALALLIDVIVVSIVVHFCQQLLPRAIRHDIGPGLLPVLATYAAILWKLRGTTIGGIVCGLKVVRLDDRPVDWATTIVRALGCFLSLVVAGFGFVWVAFDREKQSWHDKIAGTTVVRAPKGVTLV